MGDEDLGFDIKMGVEDLSILKIKNHGNRLSQANGPDVVSNIVKTSEAPEGEAAAVVPLESTTALVETKDQDDEIARLQHKLNEDQAKLAEAQKAKADMHHFAANQNLATET